MTPIRGLTMLKLTVVSLFLLPQSQVYPDTFWANRSEEVPDLGRPPSRVPGITRSGNEDEYLDEAEITDPCLSSLIALESGEEVVNAQAVNGGGEMVCSDSLADEAITQSPQAVIWVYFPDYNIPELPLKITLEDAQGRADESWQINLSEPSGVQCFELPYPLMPDSNYKWELEARFTSSPAKNPTVGGLIKYDPSASSTWKDQLTTVGQQLITAPDAESRTQWLTLLRAEGLDIIADMIPNATCLTLD